MSEEITKEYLKKILNYNEENGFFTWQVALSKRVKVGEIAGTISNWNYIVITINKKLYSAHRLAWLYVYGEFPELQLDHINGIATDNRISNLRLCNNSQNSMNKGIRSDNKSGFKGVSYEKKTGKFRSTIGINGKNIHLGMFDYPEDAYEEYKKASIKLHGEFSRVI